MGDCLPYLCRDTEMTERVISELSELETVPTVRTVQDGEEASTALREATVDRVLVGPEITFEAVEGLLPQLRERPAVRVLSYGREDDGWIPDGLEGRVESVAGESDDALAVRVAHAIERDILQERTRQAERTAALSETLGAELARAQTREEIDETVCEAVLACEPYEFVWIGQHRADGHIVPRAGAGNRAEQLDEIDISTNRGQDPGPTERAVQTGCVQREQHVAANPASEPPFEWMSEHGAVSIAAVPLACDGGSYGVLNIHADRTDAFDVGRLEQLGERIAAAHARVTRTDELELNGSRFRTFFEECPDAIFVHDETGSILEVNKRAVETLGYPREQLCSMGLSDIETTHDPEQTQETWQQQTVGETVTMDGTQERKDGSTFPVEIWVTKLEVSGEIRFLAVVRDITRQRQRERKLQRLTERLELAIEGATLGVWDWNLQTGKIEFNDQWAEMLGYSPSEIEPHIDAWEQRIHQDDMPDVDAEIEAHIAGETDYYASEHRLQTASGGWKWVQSIGEIVDRDDDGTPRRAVGIHIDIDERKEYETELVQARAELRQVIDMVPDLIFAKNEAGEYILANETTAGYYGLTSEEVEGKTDRDVLPSAEDAERFRAHDREILDGGEPRHVGEETMMTAEGDERILQTTRIPYETAGTGEEAILGYARDVTELRTYERELQRYKELVENVPVGIYRSTADTPGEFVEVNPATVAMFDADSAEELLSTDVEQLFTDPEDRNVFVERLRDRGILTEVEVKLETLTGEPFWGLITAIATHDDGTAYFDGVLQDITERKEFEQRLQEQRDNLEVLNQVVRHDIRNDLQIVLSYADALERQLDDGGNDYIGKILDSTRSAIEITDSAREVAEAMLQAEADLKPVNCRYVLENEISEIRDTYDTALVTTDGPVPDIRVQADDMLESVFRNLLTNAIEHNDKEIPKITVSATRRGDNVVITVADNGPGIADERKAEIFEEGKQGLDSSGTGLGLYLVHTLVKRYGGDVSVEDSASTTGADEALGGAVFSLELPIASGQHNR